MTRFFYSLCFALFTSTASLTLWATTLTVSENLIVTEIDNKIVDHGLLGTKSIFSLSKGSHALIVFYKDVFEDIDFAEDRLVESKDFVVKFTVSEEKQVNLATVAINNLAQAESFAKSPELIIKNERNKQIKIELANVSEYKIAQQVDLAVNTYASKQNIKNDQGTTLAETATLNMPTTSSNINQQTNNTLIKVNSLAMLKYWWQNASAEQKKYFQQHISVKK